VAFLVMWVLYLSIVNVGQTFYGFGWETLLLEAGFLAAFLGSRDSPPPLPVMVLFWWLVFRLEFGAGMIKMRGDRSWRDLTALYYHHETQPMPNPVSRTAHLLPRWFHRGEVMANHVSQLVVPFLLFVPGTVGTVAALVVVATQGWLVLTGNFAWLNVLTMVLGFSAVADPAGFGAAGASSDEQPWWFVGLVLAVTAVLVVLSVRPFLNLVSRHQLMNASFEPLRLVNAYGAFGSVTTERLEVVVEGTRDEAGASGWVEYGFRGKPGDPTRRPRQFAPYHLRLDWLMWFLALGRLERWFTVFLVRLLEADRPTLRLLRVDPFDGAPPRWVRARLFRYRFAHRDERRETGLYWIREPLGELVGPVGLGRRDATTRLDGED
jgi:hypothetical protein